MCKSKQQVGIWLLVGVFMVVIQVVIGGITRLTESGLSITKWDVVIGTLPPMNHQEWEKVFNDYRQSPQGKLINTDMNLKGFKTIFWWEYIHRLWARLFAPVFLIPLIIFLAQKKIERKLLYRLLFVFVLGGLQGALGWFMVSTGLNNVPWVSPYSLCAHLLLATILLAYLLWLALQQFYTDSFRNNSSLKKFSWLIVIIVFIQLGLGAFMAGGIAPAAIWYPTFPKIGSSWIPENTFMLSNPQWHTLLENPAFVQLTHRSTAYILVLLVLFFWLKARKLPVSPAVKSGINLLLVVIAVQVTLGIFTLINSQGKVPVTLGVLHQLGGLATFSIAVFILFHCYSDKGNKSSRQKISASTPSI